MESTLEHGENAIISHIVIIILCVLGPSDAYAYKTGKFRLIHLEPIWLADFYAF